MQLRSSSFSENTPPERPVEAVEPSSRRRLVIGASAAAVLALAAAVTVAVVAPKGAVAPAAMATTATASAASASASRTATKEPSLHDLTNALLDRQAQALLKGDQAGWLAAVDPGKPKVRAFYQDLYASLRALDVTQLQYAQTIPKPVGGPGDWTDTFYLTYCFSSPTCPKFMYKDIGGPGAPMISQSLTFRLVKGEWRITAVGTGTFPDTWQPTPWQAGGMVYQKGSRVTVGASRGHESRIREVVTAADRAAATADKFAAKLGVAKSRYRVYMATDKEWKTWFGGQRRQSILGYASFPHTVQAEVVIRASTMGRGADLQNLLQHELGHVASLTGTKSIGADFGFGNDDMWLMEGLAEYISYSPRPATASDRAPAVRALVNSSQRRTSIHIGEMPADASPELANQFYGWSHFGVDCLARKYGEAKMLDFVKGRLRDDLSYDEASQRAFGSPLRPVDRSCVAWIKQQL